MLANQDFSALIIRRIPASVARTYLAFIDPDILSRWTAAEAGSEVVATVDPRTGGSFQLVHTRGPQAGRISNGFFKDLNPAGGIIQTWADEGPGMPGTGRPSLVTLEMRSVLADVTQLTVTHALLPGAQARQFYNDDWSRRLDGLEAYFSALPQA